MERATRIADKLIDIYDGPRGREHYGEGVTQIAHALQCAYFASRVTDDEVTIVAALLHDIGHVCQPDSARMVGGLGAVDHESLGADYLRELGFPEKVVELVGSHVDAKRYLVATNPEYAANLSSASAQTLVQQGGPMTRAEVQEFDCDPLKKEKLQMRSWDEMGKETDLGVAPFGDYRERIARVLTSVA